MNQDISSERRRPRYRHKEIRRHSQTEEAESLANHTVWIIFIELLKSVDSCTLTQNSTFKK